MCFTRDTNLHSKCSHEVVLSLQILPPCADTESDRCCGMERVWLARSAVDHGASGHQKSRKTPPSSNFGIQVHSVHVYVLLIHCHLNIRAFYTVAETCYTSRPTILKIALLALETGLPGMNKYSTHHNMNFQQPVI